MDRLILTDVPGEDAVEMDVLIVGAGPAGLSAAIELSRLAAAAAAEGKGRGDLSIGVLDKAGALGEHSLSGAVINPRAFHELFPDLAESELPFRQKVPGEAVYFLTDSRSVRIPTPPTMRNHDFFTASISEVVRWRGPRPEAGGGHE
jgi:electron-transferring-flavoprotein dehydrogenase